MLVIGDIGRLGAKRQPEKTALVMGEDSLSYRELNARANRLAHGLIARGVQTGDRVAILAENSIDYVVVVLAVAKTGAWLVPMNFRYSGEEIAYVVENCTPRAVVTGSGYTQKLIDATAAGLTRPEAIAITTDYEDQSRVVPMSELMSAQPDGEPARLVNPEAPAMVMYTSGTTGFPKGVLFSHAAYLANHQVIAFEGDLEHSDVALVPLPLFHNGGLNVVVLPALMLGASVVLMGKGFTPAAMLEAVEHHRATLAIIHRLKRKHASCRLGDAAEGPDQVDLDNPVKSIKREMLDRTVFLRTAGGLDRVARASAVDQDTFLTMRRARFGKARVDAFVAGDVDVAEYAANFSSQCITLVGLQIEYRDLHAFGGKRPRSCFAKARCAACNHCCDC